MGFDPAKILENLISGSMKGSSSKKVKGTPVHGAASKIQSTLEGLLGGQGNRRTSGSTTGKPKPKLAGETTPQSTKDKAEHMRRVSAFANKRGIKSFKEAESILKRQGEARARKGGSSSGPSAQAASDSKKAVKKARKMASGKKTRNAKRRAKRRN
jgi:hypothetical protein